MITINDIHKGVITALKQHFPDIKRSGEAFKQGFESPCFFVKLLSVQHDREVNRRYKRYHSFDIHYFPASETDANKEMLGVAERLYNHMEYIEVKGGLCRGSSMNHEIVDGVLHFFVDYDFHVIRSKISVPKMEKLLKEVGVDD